VTGTAGVPSAAGIPGVPGVAARGPQQDRSRATRQALLTAAVECLAEYGWAASTVSVVAARAGVSRGAAQHHFPTREALMTAAIEHVTEVRDIEIRRELAAGPPGPLDVAAALDIIASWFVGQYFRAALEVWVAALADPVLHELVVPLEARTGRHAHRGAVELLHADESVEGVREIVQATLDMARGLGLADLMTDDSARRARILQQWARVLEAELAR
jgi:AcrR family transcriptional regulator